MKKVFSRMILCVFAVMMLVGTVSAAADGARSSLYLDAYRAWLTPVSGAKINVNVDVQAVDYMDDVGATSIIVYESSDGGNTWSDWTGYASAMYPEMLVQDDYWYYDTAIVHEGTAGYRYYAIVTVYAGDSTGSDSKEYITPIVTARN